jgi:rubrerythrin
MPTTGEKPDEGTYRCKMCGALVKLDVATNTLPPCRSAAARSS